jgi:transposase
MIFAFAAWVVGVQPPRAPGASAGEEPNSEKRPKKSRRGRHPGRAALPSHLERVPEVNPLPPNMRVCPLCGTPMTTVGHSICEILDVRPAQLHVRQRLDERVACPNDDTIVSAPTPPELVERGKLGATLIVESLADKFLEHEPVERQCLRWARSGGRSADDGACRRHGGRHSGGRARPPGARLRSCGGRAGRGGRLPASRCYRQRAGQGPWSSDGEPLANPAARRCARVGAEAR